MYRLVFQNRDAARPSFTGGDAPVVIGREPDCAVRLTEAGVGDRHAAIERRADGYHIRDLGTANGTRVNGQRVAGQRLANGDEIEVGAARLKFEIAPDPPPDRRAFDPWQAVAVAAVTVLVAGQIGLFVWIFAQPHPRGTRTDIVRGRQPQAPAPAATDNSPSVLAPLPATAAPEAGTPSTPEVLTRMLRITRVDRSDAPDGVTLRIQIKAQVGERALDTGAVGVSAQCGERVVWAAVPADWDNFTTRTLSVKLTGACPSYVVRTFYRKKLQDVYPPPAGNP
jgi:predicted component of type VI protein secretion system